MLITADVLAPQLSISVDQVYRLARTRQIPSHRLGNAVRFNLEEVLAATAVALAPPPLVRPVPSSTRHQARTRARKTSDAVP